MFFKSPSGVVQEREGVVKEIGKISQFPAPIDPYPVNALIQAG